MHYGWPAPSLPQLLSESSHIPIDDNLGYWLATGPIFSAVIGSLTIPLFIDKIGRQKSILLVTIPYLTTWILIFFSTNFEMLLAGRLVAGVADGWALCSVPIYIGEISDPKIRGLLGSFVPISYICGVLLIDIIGSYCTVQMTALIACVLPIMLVATFVFMPESPYFLVMKGQVEAAKKKLQILRGREDVEKEILRIQNGIKEDLSVKSNPLDLFRIPSNRKAIILLLAIRACQEFSGDSAITFYTQNIFKEAGTTISEDLASIIFFVIELVVTIITASVVDRFGRRPLLILSAFGSAVALLVEGLYFYFKICTDIDLSNVALVPLLALILFVICFSAGLKVIPFLFLGELFPQSVKATAVCVADLFAAAAIVCVSKFFQATRDYFGMHVPFLSFGVCCAAGLLYMILCVPETKGKTLEEIQDYFRGKRTSEEKNIEEK